MRALPDSFDSAVVAEIDGRLVEVRLGHGVAVPWAIESGSRAWGFPSPDSDYDCRFFFVRPLRRYADPWPPREVIETPLEGLLDINGWDLIKAVRLAAKGNATVAEWLRSPMVYDGEPAFRDELLSFIDATANRPAIIRHYLHVGRDHWAQSGAATGDSIVLKRVFYALRPAAALHWLSIHRDRTTPPMNLHELLDQAAPPPAVQDAVDHLVAAKAVTRELGSGVVDPALIGWVESTFAAARDAEAGAGSSPETRELGSAVFRSMLQQWAPA
jgi:uncharacterized protein